MVGQLKGTWLLNHHVKKGNMMVGDDGPGQEHISLTASSIGVSFYFR